MGHEWWKPCESVVGLLFGKSSDADPEFCNKYKLVTSKENDEFGHDCYETIDGSVELIFDQSGFASACFLQEFRVASTNVIGVKSLVLKDLLIGSYSIEPNDIVEDNWIDVDDGYILRDIDIRRLCMFWTEDKDERVISVSVYG